MPYVNDIFIFFEVFEKEAHVLDILFTLESDVGRGNLFNLRGNEGVAQSGKLFCNSGKIFGLAVDLVNVAFFSEVCRTCFKSLFHEFITVNDTVAPFVESGYCDNALLFKEEAYAANLSEVAAEFIEIMANVTRGTVTVVGSGFYDNGNAARAVAFVGDFFVSNGIGTGSLDRKSVV